MTTNNNILRFGFRHTGPESLTLPVEGSLQINNARIDAMQRMLHVLNVPIVCVHQAVERTLKNIQTVLHLTFVRLAMAP